MIAFNWYNLIPYGTYFVTVSEYFIIQTFVFVTFKDSLNINTFEERTAVVSDDT